ncbi:TPA: hypothetical protein O2E07_000177 [Staphylococcus aureus]|nr:hypothetical protein [Staphylococcus aureus]HCY9632048.1 hypothetical protein [Staphylococcus aureus]HDE8035153.1 hypothetical protein [Staphylococcus aureus]HDE8465276.1 hypothetical protein [Staphylococcus aureus]HDE8681684.1 hypothetical protein [Staphylococcus aureus]
MMLKFRAWDKYEKTMLDVHGINFDEYGVWTRELIDDEDDGGFILTEDVKLLQYTGLKDKNNNEIYAGDIVEFDISVAYEYDILNKAIVTMSNVGGVKPTLFTMEECGDVVEWSYFEKDIDELDFFDDCKVVGNIYETPHLL